VLPSFKPKTASEDKPILSSNESGPTFKVKPVIASSSSAAASSASYSGGGIGRGPVLPSSSPGGFSNGGTQGNSNANGNPNGPITVAARQDVDYGPYRQDLERRIHQAWRAPEHDKDSRVLVSFAIKRDGSLVTSSIRTTQSSSPEAEAAARQAIYDASPGFRPLPDGAPDSVRVDFTFTQTGTRFAGIKKY
jgi:outer membrane biosynthesis protein TonB